MYDPADVPDHICAVLGELQPECDGYYCRLEREAIAEADALAGGETDLDEEAEECARAAAIIDWELTENVAWWIARRAAKEASA